MKKIENPEKHSKNIMVMGSSGYIGTNLVDFFQKKDDIWPFPYDKKTGTLGENWSDVAGYDAIVLLASFPGIINCRADINRAVIDNISVAFNIMNQARLYRVPVIFTSSQAAKEPFDNFYATIKKIIEIEAFRLNDLGADNRILRLTNVYGGHQYLEKKNTVVKQFIMARRNKTDMIINGTGEQIRDFLHVNDVCEAIYKCILHDQKVPEPVDIGTGIGVSVKTLAEMFDSDLTYDADSDTVGADESIADTNLADDLFGFHAKEILADYLNEI